MERCNVSLLVEIIYTSDGLLTKYFVYISGENVSLARAEVNRLTRLSGCHRGIQWDGRVGLIDCQKNPVPFLLERAALVKEAGIVLFETDVQKDFYENLSDDIIMDSVKPDETFSVRTISDRSDFSANDRLVIEADLGEYIKRVLGSKVDLKNPQVRILVVFTQNSVRVCKSFSSSLRVMLRKREPGQKPFFHPSMMNAILARVMCNLVGVTPDETVLDPFCGGGGILCEASLIGGRVVGIDLNWRLLTGCRKNLSIVSDDYSIIQGDVRNLPVQVCDCIVTDPPYGRASSTRGAQAIALVESLFIRVDSMLRRHEESICICGASEMKLQDLAEKQGLVVNQVLRIKVHSGLVRELLILGI